MVEDQLRRRGITDERVLAAMERVPRELFVPEPFRDQAYDDAALPIGEGQTISQPYMVARICETLALRGSERVLDVGTGSGYQAAVLAELAAEVHTIERHASLAERARAALAARGLRAGDRPRRRRDARRPRARPVRRDRRRRGRARAAAVAVRAARARRPPRRSGGRPRRPGAPARRQHAGGPRHAAERRRAASSRSSGRRASPPSDPGTFARVARSTAAGVAAARAGRALRRPQNWLELLKFCLVGASGYVVNLAVYIALLKGADMHYLAGRGVLLRRRRDEQLLVEPALDLPRAAREPLLPGRPLPARLAAVSLGLNLLLLRGLVALGVGKIAAQAIAIILVTPFSFSVNKLWSFRR